MEVYTVSYFAYFFFPKNCTCFPLISIAQELTLLMKFYAVEVENKTNGTERDRAKKRKETKSIIAISFLEIVTVDSVHYRTIVCTFNAILCIRDVQIAQLRSAFVNRSCLLVEMNKLLWKRIHTILSCDKILMIANYTSECHTYEIWTFSSEF